MRASLRNTAVAQRPNTRSGKVKSEDGDEVGHVQFSRRESEKVRLKPFKADWHDTQDEDLDAGKPPWTWISCDSCQKWRICAWEYPNQANLAAKGNKWACCPYPSSLGEVSCQDASIWHLTLTFLTDCMETPHATQKAESRKDGAVVDDAHTRRIRIESSAMCRAANMSLQSPGNGDQFIDISYLFLAVRCFSSWDRLVQHKGAAQNLVQKLGLTGLRKDQWQGYVHALEDFYKQLFAKDFGRKGASKALRNTTLEMFLMSDQSVRDTILCRQDEILRDLGVDAQGIGMYKDLVVRGMKTANLNERQLLEGSNLPGLTDHTIAIHRSDGLENLLEHCAGALTHMLEMLAKSDNKLHMSLAGCLQKLLDAVNACLRCDEQLWQRLKLVLVGQSSVGKSFMFDSLLRISERSRCEYALGGLVKEQLEAFVEGRLLVERRKNACVCDDDDDDNDETQAQPRLADREHEFIECVVPEV
jgi:hypothetical protein